MIALIKTGVAHVNKGIMINQLKFVHNVTILVRLVIKKELMIVSHVLQKYSDQTLANKVDHVLA